MKIFKMSPQAYQYYIENVRGNENTSYDQACRKMSRNIQLVKEFSPDQVTKSFGKASYWYGNMLIKVKGKKVVELVNHKGEAKRTNVDEKRYIELSKKLGLK